MSLKNFMKSFFVYILRCADRSLYVGRTQDLERRLAEHCNRQGCAYTALRLPVEMVFSQNFANENEAYTAEQQIKGWSRKKKEALINNDWNQIVKLSNRKRNILRHAQDE